MSGQKAKGNCLNVGSTNKIFKIHKTPVIMKKLFFMLFLY